MKPGEVFNPRQRALFGFVKCPMGLLRSQAISPGAKLCWAFLADLDGSDGCFAGREYIGEALGISTQSVKRYLRELRDAGLIRIGHRDSGPDRRINRYEFIWQDLLKSGLDSTHINRSDPTHINGSDSTLTNGSESIHSAKMRVKSALKIRVKSERPHKEEPENIRTRERTAPPKTGAAARSTDGVVNDYPVLKRPQRPDDWDDGNVEAV